MAPSPTPLQPVFKPGAIATESPSTHSLLTTLHLTPHPEGGYFTELDRDPRSVPNPFTHSYTTTSAAPLSGDNARRNASTSILYCLTPARPQGHFHRNAGRTVHTLIEGRGRYVIIHADEAGREKRVESFVVGRDVQAGERVVWVVEGGKYKASFLLEGEGDRLLISEVCCLTPCVGEVADMGRLWCRGLSMRIMIF